jgi:hypothetical protein
MKLMPAPQQNMPTAEMRGHTNWSRE